MTWPVSPATYGTYQYFLRETGAAMGLEHDDSRWTQAQRAKADSLVQRGYRYFLTPPVLPVPENHKAKPSYRWSFLFPTGSISLVAGTDTYDLPSDFAGQVQCFTARAGSTAKRITIVPDETLRQAKLATSSTGTPTVASISPLSHTGDSLQRYQVTFFPNPTAAMTVDYDYAVVPANLSPANRFPYGQALHAETILAACVAAVEESILGKRGERWSSFLERLGASITQDQQALEAASQNVWPTDNPATTLAIDYFAIQRHVGLELGFGPNALSWTQEQTQLVEQCIEQGCLQYYFPPVVEGGRASHEWSFLRPLAELVTSEDQQVYDLPPDFDRMFGSLTFVDENNLYPPIAIISDTRMRELHSQQTLTGPPVYASVRPMTSAPGFEERQGLVLFPTPDDTYRLQYQYHAVQRRLSATAPYPLGGQIHGQGILASCLSFAETKATGKEGTHFRRFMRCLASAIHSDYRRGPDVLGYNGDGRNLLPLNRADARSSMTRGLLTYNDVSYQSDS